MLQNYNISGLSSNLSSVVNFSSDAVPAFMDIDKKINLFQNDLLLPPQDFCPRNEFNRTLSVDLIKEKPFIENVESSFNLEKFIEKMKAEEKELKRRNDRLLPTCPKLEFNVSPIRYSLFNTTLPLSSYKHISVTDGSPVDTKWLQEVDECLATPSSFHLIEEGISSSYLIRNKYNTPIAIYKPTDQAGGSKNNPKGAQILFDPQLGEDASVREYGARLVGGDFFGTPELHLVKIVMNGKIEAGSIQKFMPSDGTGKDIIKPETDALLSAAGIQKTFEQMENLNFGEAMKLHNFMQDDFKLWTHSRNTQAISSRYFSQMGKEVHKMGLLDILIQNPDRLNPANYLYKKIGNNIRLTPIDHNLAFPEEISPLLEQVIWMNSPAALLPFDQEVINYINDLDIEAISSELAKAGMNEKRIHNFKIMGLVVKKCVDAGLPLREIGQLSSINFINMLSGTTLQKMEKEAKKTASTPEEFFPIFSSLLEKKIEKIQNQRDRQGVSNAAKAFHLLKQPEIYSSFKNWQQVASCMKDKSNANCRNNAKRVKEFYYNGTCLSTKALFRD